MKLHFSRVLLSYRNRLNSSKSSNRVANPKFLERKMLS